MALKYIFSITIPYQNIMQELSELEQLLRRNQFWKCSKPSHVVSGRERQSDIVMSLLFFPPLYHQTARLGDNPFPIGLIYYCWFLLYCIISHSFTISRKLVSLYLNNNISPPHFSTGFPWGECWEEALDPAAGMKDFQMALQTPKSVQKEGRSCSRHSRYKFPIATGEAHPW